MSLKLFEFVAAAVVVAEGCVPPLLQLLFTAVDAIPPAAAPPPNALLFGCIIVVVVACPQPPLGNCWTVQCGGGGSVTWGGGAMALTQCDEMRGGRAVINCCCVGCLWRLFIGCRGRPVTESVSRFRRGCSTGITRWRCFGNLERAWNGEEPG